MPPLAVAAAKEAVIAAEAAGARRRASRASGALFATLFATEDQKEGMAAFLEKRPPTWTGR